MGKDGENGERWGGWEDVMERNGKDSRKGRSQGGQMNFGDEIISQS